MHRCVEFVDLGKVVLEIRHLCSMIQLFVRNNIRVDLKVWSVENFGVLSAIFGENLIAVRFEFFMVIYND